VDFKDRAKKFFINAYETAIHEASPDVAIRTNLKLENNKLGIGQEWISLKEIDHIYVIGFGKAAATMATVVEDILVDLIVEGVVVTKYDHSVPLKKIKVYEANHPVPDEAGVKATHEIINLLNKTSEKDLVISLISGGGSALLVHPRPGITLEDKQKVTRLMLKNGVPIEKMNVVRKHLSAVKGGQLAQLALPAPIYSFIISDVIGDKLEAIASGATTPDPSSFLEAEEILKDYSIWEEFSTEFKNWFQQQVSSPEAETPKPGDPNFSKVKNMIIANNQGALQAVKSLAEKNGYTPIILSSRVEGEAKEIARFYGAIAKEIRLSNQPLKPPACIIAGGETTVNVIGTGKGGRNTEMVLAVLNDLFGLGDTAFFSVGTDGTDGPTDAAGAFGFSDSLIRAENLQLNSKEYLKNNDSYSFFKKMGDIFCPGASGTNVIDVQILLVD
jgi:glycerate 2-kinase